MNLLSEKEFYLATALTILRILAGFILGALAGIISGILTSSFKVADIIISPALRVIRAVPVVSFIILAFLFMSIDALPIFISFLMVTPLVWQSTNDSLNSSCKELAEMGRVFKMSKSAILFKIKLPASLGEIATSLVTGLGFAWKSGVAAEVLYSPNISIGKSIYIAKANLDKVILVGDTLVGAVKSGYLAAGGEASKLTTVKTLDLAKPILGEWLKAGDCVLFLNDLPDVY